MKHIVNKVNYKNADKCHKCPGKNGSDGCPWWWTTKRKNDETQEEVLVEECGKTNLPFYLDFVVEMSVRPAAEVGALRNEVHGYIQEGFQSLVQGMIESAKMKQITEEDEGNG